MANCRCSEISTHKEKIQKLENSMNRFRTVDTHISSMGASLSNMSGTYAAAFTSEKVGELCSATTAMDDDLISDRGAILGRIQNKKAELESQLKGMEVEDQHYHEEEEERKRKEREANQQAS